MLPKISKEVLECFTPVHKNFNWIVFLIDGSIQKLVEFNLAVYNFVLLNFCVDMVSEDSKITTL